MQERPTAAIKHDRRACLPVAQWYRVLHVKAGLADCRVEVIVLYLAVHKRNLPQHARVFSRHTFR